MKAGRWTAPPGAPSPVDAARDALEQAQRRRTIERSRLDMMTELAQTDSCRTRALLAHFGEVLDRPCGHCDACHEGLAADPPQDGPFPLQSRLTHHQWGTGTVLRYEGEQMTVLFDDVGYKTLSVPVVVEKQLVNNGRRPRSARAAPPTRG